MSFIFRSVFYLVVISFCKLLFCLESARWFSGSRRSSYTQILAEDRDRLASLENAGTRNVFDPIL